MKIIKQVLFFTLLIFVALGLYKAVALLTKSRDDQTLIVGTSADYPPYAFVDTKTDEIVGFDIDVAREVVTRLGKKFEAKDIPFTTLMFDLFSQDIDIVAAGMTPTARRSRKVLFSQTYLQADPLVVLTQKDDFSVKDVSDLQNKTVVVNTGYTADLYLSDKPDIDLMKLKTPADGFMALKSGRADAFVCAKSSLATLQSKKHMLDQFDIFVLPDTGDDYSLAVHKNNDELLQRINNVLSDMDKDGTLQKLKEKWNLS